MKTQDTGSRGHLSSIPERINTSIYSCIYPFLLLMHLNDSLMPEFSTSHLSTPNICQICLPETDISFHKNTNSSMTIVHWTRYYCWKRFQNTCRGRQFSFSDTTPRPKDYQQHVTWWTPLLFFFFFLIYFIYLFLAALGLCCCARAQAFSSCGERGPLLVAVRGLLIAVVSLVAEHGL